MLGRYNPWAREGIVEDTSSWTVELSLIVSYRFIVSNILICLALYDWKCLKSDTQ